MREYSDADDLRNVDATVAIEDGRVSMATEGEASVYVDVPDERPLANIQTLATVRVHGPDFRAEVELDCIETEILLEALQEAVDDV